MRRGEERMRSRRGEDNGRGVERDEGEEEGREGWKENSIVLYHYGINYNLLGEKKYQVYSSYIHT